MNSINLRVLTPVVVIWALIVLLGAANVGAMWRLTASDPIVRVIAVVGAALSEAGAPIFMQSAAVASDCFFRRAGRLALAFACAAYNMFGAHAAVIYYADVHHASQRTASAAALTRQVTELDGEIDRMVDDLEQVRPDPTLDIGARERAAANDLYISEAQRLEPRIAELRARRDQLLATSEAPATISNTLWGWVLFIELLKLLGPWWCSSPSTSPPSPAGGVSSRLLSRWVRQLTASTRDRQHTPSVTSVNKNARQPGRSTPAASRTTADTLTVNAIRHEATSEADNLSTNVNAQNSGMDMSTPRQHRRRRRKVGADDVREFVALHETGMSLRDIGHRVGFSHETVRQHLPAEVADADDRPKAKVRR